MKITHTAFTMTFANGASFEVTEPANTTLEQMKAKFEGQTLAIGKDGEGPDEVCVSVTQPTDRAQLLADAREAAAQSVEQTAKLQALRTPGLRAMIAGFTTQATANAMKRPALLTEARALLAAGLIDAATIAAAAAPKAKAHSVHHSSKSDEWATPQSVFDALNEEFKFQLDAAATDENHKCERYYTKEQDSLKQSWQVVNGSVWVNPPYSRGLQARFIEKAYRTAKSGAARVVMLIPARPDTTSWHEFIIGNPDCEVRFIKGRLKFGGHTDAAPFPSAIVIFRPALSSHLGFTVRGVEVPGKPPKSRASKTAPTVNPYILPVFRVTLANGFSYETAMSMQTTITSAERYFLGSMIICEPFPSEERSECVKVEQTRLGSY